MSNLHERFEAKGIDKDWIAEQLKDIVESKSESHQIRIFALENIIKITKENDTPKDLVKTITKSKELADDEHDKVAQAILSSN